MRFFQLGLIALIALHLPAAAAAEWKKYETEHFVVFSESSETRAVELATGLEKIDALMRVATNLPRDVEPVKVRPRSAIWMS